MTYGRVDGQEGSVADLSLVAVNSAGDSEVPNDLMSRLTAQLNEDRAILEPSDVLVFHIVVGPTKTTGSTTEFRYPKSIYLDRFLNQNAELSSQRRARQREMVEELARLGVEKKSLTSLNVSITVLATQG